MKNIVTYILFFFAFFLFKSLHAQPGAYGGELKFKVYKDDKIVNLSDTKWKVDMHNGSFMGQTNPYAYPDFYSIIPKKTPMGGTVANNFYLELVFGKDTMKVYPPDFKDEKIILDSIPFKVGTYKIPNHIYNLKQTIEQNKAYNYIPRLNGTWDLFSNDKFETYKCYLEKIKDIEHASRQNMYTTPNEWDKMLTNGRQEFTFRNNVIISTDDGKNYRIYEVKNISETTFWGENILGKIHLISLFQEKHTIYALVEKFYGGTNPSGTTYGIYKLHFIEKEASKQLIERLKGKQTEEDYQAAVRFTNKHLGNVWSRKRLTQIKEIYDKKKTK